jgi:23S rRNA pseudouridine1911/1915/1917 synthase
MVSPPVSERILEVRFVVEANYAGWRLDRYLCEKIQRLSRSQVKRIIQRDLENQGLKPSSPVRPGQSVVLHRRARPEPTAPEGLPVIYEDDDLVVVDKPAGLAMHPTALYYQTTLVARIRALFPNDKPDPAHRLDRETSGLVVCGKRPEVTGRLKAAFASGQVRKSYLALVEGHPPPELEIDRPLAMGTGVVRVRVVVDEESGRPSRTRITTLQRRSSALGEPFALVRAEPFTGRQHQIRAHLASAGFPVVGDKIYGPDEQLFVKFTEQRLTEEDLGKLRLARHALHAATLSAEHPCRREPMAWRAPLPEDLRTFFERLGPISRAGRVPQVAEGFPSVGDKPVAGGHEPGQSVDCLVAPWASSQ